MMRKLWIRLAALSMSALLSTATLDCFGRGGGTVQGDLDDGGVVIID